ncbi:MAG: hypothetical protein DWH91_12470 [Planctomycetota bacterium]|nr:MAG: hypothetical protein DWH91_12470 [Planctomycetota bacterium]
MSYRIFCLAAILLPAIAQAQLPQPRLYSLHPAGVQAGQTVEVSITGGDDLEEINALLFNHLGLTATPKLNDQQQPVDRVFLVTAAADAPVGPQEVRCKGLWGVSNARRFYVGSRPQTNEVEPNNTLDKAMPLTVGTAIQGKMDGGADVDLFKFAATAGQRLVIEISSDRIDSKLHPIIEIHDVSSRRRLSALRGNGASDPVLVFDVPANGDYLLKLHDGAFRGGNEHFYRLDVHTAPYVEFVYPPSGTAGQTAKFSLFGYNLPGGQRVAVPGYKTQLDKLDIDIAVPGDASTLQLEDRTTSLMAATDAFSYRLPSPAGPSNAVSIGIAQAPVIMETEPNNAPVPGKNIPVPSEVVGQFSDPRDVDTYFIDAHAKEVLYIEAYGQRLGQTVDPYVTIDRINVDAQGKETIQRVAAPDDEPTNPLANQYDVRSDDPVQRLEVPADGKYRITIRDRFGESRGSAANVYRLSIRADQPDFRLVALPASPTAGAAWSMAMRKGDTFAMHVIAFRRDGFTGPIDVLALDLPAGVECSGTTIPDGMPLGMLTFRSKADAAEGWNKFRIEGKAKIEDPRLARAVVAANAAIPEAEKPIANLQKAVDDAAKKTPPAQEALNKSEEALKAKPDDQSLIQARDKAKAALEAAQSAEKKAQDDLAAVQQKITDLKAAAAAATQASTASIREVAHSVRAGEIAWTGANNVPSVGRIRKEFAISILAETAPFQIVAEPIKLEVHQGRQVLVPVKLEKRDGFNDKVTLNAAGAKPNANIDAPNIAIEKDQTETTWRLYVKDNALPGTHSMWLTSTAPVPYRRNPAKADRLKAEFDKVAAEAKTAADAVPPATQAKNEAVTKATQATETLKKSQADQQTMKKAMDDNKAASDKSATAQTEAEKQATAAAEAVKAAQAAFDAAKTASEGDAANEEKKKALTAAEEALNKAKADAEAKEKAKTDATKAATDAATALTTATENLKKADELVTKSTADDKAAQEAKAGAEKGEKEKQDAAKALEDKRKAAEKASTDQANASKPNNINFTPPAVPVILVVKPAPLKLAPNVPNSGNLKKGDKLEVKVGITRQNGFAGVVTLSLPAQPGLVGVAAADVIVPADQNEGLLTITAAGDAKDGAQVNLVIRAKADFSGEALVEVPLAVNVTP